MNAFVHTLNLSYTPANLYVTSRSVCESNNSMGEPMGAEMHTHTHTHQYPYPCHGSWVHHGLAVGGHGFVPIVGNPPKPHMITTITNAANIVHFSTMYMHNTT